jgi:hypothetical protein
MLTKSFYVLLLTAVLVSCKSKTAFNYNEKIVAMEKSLEPEIEAVESKLEKFAGGMQFDSIAVVSSNMEKSVQKRIDEINNNPAPKAKEGDNFKKAVLIYFTFIKDIYTASKNIGLAKTQEERVEMATKLNELVADKQEALNDLQSAQKKYADANGFKVQ